jgi:hypothetical protein
VTALLAGGYTYWVWGNSTNNGGDFIIGAFDSHGVYQKSLLVPGNRQLTSLAISGSQLVVAGQTSSNLQVPWADLDWFTPAAVTVNINFSFPTVPTITLSGGAPVLDSTKPDLMVVDPQLTGLSLVQWTIDGLTTYASDSTSFIVNGQSIITVNSGKLSPGTHELMIEVTDGVHVYSANFNFTVVYLNVPS